MMWVGWSRNLPEKVLEEEFSRGRKLLTLPINGVVWNRVKFGEAKDYEIQQIHLERYGCCGDCGARPGEVHIPICDEERCPNCKEQLNSCDCTIGPLGPEWDAFQRERNKTYELFRGATRPAPPKNLVK